MDVVLPLVFGFHGGSHELSNEISLLTSVFAGGEAGTQYGEVTSLRFLKSC